VCESAAEIEAIDRLARASQQRVGVLLRINPLRMPRGFGVNMAGKPSQFGIDEEEMPALLEALPRHPQIDLLGFHVYSGTNCLDPEAIVENYAIFIELFQRFARAHDLAPRKLVFGSGLGIPYFAGDKELDLAALAARVNPMLDALRAEPRFAATTLVLELGRFLVGPAGYLLTSVIGAKRSRNTEIRLCDAGFNNHLSACGMMGTVIRRNWPIENLAADAGASTQRYMLAGPLCTTFDVLANAIDLPPTNPGDVLAVGSSGAYGLSASPSGFISHPVPREYFVRGDEVADVSETP
jgi:diaminopimelate decarboxylase